MELPDDVVIAPFGTTSTSASRQIVVAIVSGSIEHDLTKNATQMALYPDPSEKFSNDSLVGTLYRRNRSSDGGSWDGWWLHVKKGNNVLGVMISYSGGAPGKLGELKKYLSTVTWDGTLGDPEIAFGLKFDVQGMKLAHPGIGALLYTADGNVSQNQEYLYIYAIPGSLLGDMTKFHRACDAFADKMLRGKLRTPMRYQANNGIRVCDTWSGPGLVGSEYSAVLWLPGGSVILATGLGDPGIFQHALLNLHRIR
ncbi:hypothetical protein IHE47_03210 [Rhodanobacter sp. DHB23]|nr:hypothetical protein [Rhodanobacter sp. DHB23]